MSTQDAIISAKKFVELVQNTYPVEKAYLFGSHAKNIADESSDIDICIVSSKFGQNYLQEEMSLIDLAMKINPRLTPIPFNSNDISDHWNLLAHEITTYGIQLN